MSTAVANPDELLTPRQLEVLELVAKGLTNRDIGRLLKISPGTVKVHVAAITEALGVANRTEAATRLAALHLGTSPAPDTRYSVPGFGGRGAIAILPFDNFSSDPNLAFLADGLCEDLITRLAGWRWFPVIARNSSFAFRGQAIDVQRVSAELGARYVVEGSVRTAGHRARVTAQLLDGSTGAHLWAEQYDCDLDDIFAMTDTVVDGLVAELEPALLLISGLKVVTQPKQSLDTWQLIQAGFVDLSDNTAEGLKRALTSFEQAIDAGPNLASPHSFAVFALVQLMIIGKLDPTPERLARLKTLATRARTLDANDPVSHHVMGWAHLAAGEIDAALASLERAIELGPSLSWAYSVRGVALCAARRPQEALEAASQALRLSPKDPQLSYMHTCAGLAAIQADELTIARRHLKDAVREGPEVPFNHLLLAVCHALLDEIAEGQAALAAMQQIDAGFTGGFLADIIMTPEEYKRLAVAMGKLL